MWCCYFLRDLLIRKIWRQRFCACEMICSRLDNVFKLLVSDNVSIYLDCIWVVVRHNYSFATGNLNWEVKRIVLASWTVCLSICNDYSLLSYSLAEISLCLQEKKGKTWGSDNSMPCCLKLLFCIYTILRYGFPVCIDQFELERERLELELQEEKKAQVERERRIKEQEQRIENLSTLVISGAMEDRELPNKKAWSILCIFDFSTPWNPLYLIWWIPN